MCLCHCWSGIEIHLSSIFNFCLNFLCLLVLLDLASFTIPLLINPLKRWWFPKFPRKGSPRSPPWTSLPSHTLFCHLHSRSSVVSHTCNTSSFLTIITRLLWYLLLLASHRWMTLVTPKGTAQRLPPLSKGFTFQPHTSPTTPRTLSLPGKTPPLRSRLPNLWLQLFIYSLLYFLILRSCPSSFILGFALLHLTQLGFTGLISQMRPQGHQFQCCSH